MSLTEISGVSSGCQQGGCLTCSDYNGCLSCKPRFFMHLERIGMKQIGVCMTSCPPGFYGTRFPERSPCTSKRFVWSFFFFFLKCLCMKAYLYIACVNVSLWILARSVLLSFDLEPVPSPFNHVFCLDVTDTSATSLFQVIVAIYKNIFLSYTLKNVLKIWHCSTFVSTQHVLKQVKNEMLVSCCEWC